VCSLIFCCFFLLQCNALRALPFALKGFPSPNLFSFLFGVLLVAANVAMVFVNIGKPSNVLGHIDRIKFPPIPGVVGAGESFFTFKGRAMIDAVLVFTLWFILGSHLLGFMTLLLIVAAYLLKKHQTDVFNELFLDGEGPAYIAVDTTQDV
jgi:hypothetical protein